MKKLCVLTVFVLIIPCELIAKEGKWGLNIAINWVNTFLMKPDEEKAKTSTGFLGLAFGIDYYYSENSFITFGIAGAMDFFFPIPVAADPHPGTSVESIGSGHISLSNNHKIGDFAIGYGLSYAGFDKDQFSKSHSTFGLIFPTSYQVIDDFGIGLIYRPTFYRPNLITDQLAYEHLISLLLIKQFF